jgi:(E)-4-hydroxy-3-methylbut-2-enyl-diphosphate synthase
MNYNDIRRKSKEIKIGNIAIGGNNKIAIQSMTNTPTENSDATIKQIKALEAAGCDVVRITVPTLDAADTVTAIKESDIHVPIVADIHFDYKIALRCAELGVDKIRINPGNIGDDSKVKAVCEACLKRNIPIRIGVNSGSLEKSILEKYGSPCAEALVESGMYHISLLEKYDFDNIVISIKASNVENMIKANRMLAERINYPIHLGVTESGGARAGLIKSSIGIGSLLNDGIGDTIRVSLTDDPLVEVESAKEILGALDIKGQNRMNIVSCPTCGRTQINLIELVKKFEKAVDDEGLRDIPIKVALMGCVVNGPGEAREADIGIAGGKGEALLFSHGETVKKIPEEDIIKVLLESIKSYRV